MAAILHHGVFYPQSCMLNHFGHEYTWSVISRWLAADPSLPLATLLTLAIYSLGKRYGTLRPLGLPFLIAFAPLTLWIWDIPFTERIICATLHDGRAVLAEGVLVKGRHLYVFGVVAFAALTLLRYRRASRSVSGRPSGSEEVADVGARVPA